MISNVKVIFNIVILSAYYSSVIASEKYTYMAYMQHELKLQADIKAKKTELDELFKRIEIVKREIKQDELALLDRSKSNPVRFANFHDKFTKTFGSN